MSVNSLVHYANEVFGLFTIIKRRLYVTLINDGVIKTSRTSVRSLIVMCYECGTRFTETTIFL